MIIIWTMEMIFTVEVWAISSYWSYSSNPVASPVNLPVFACSVCAVSWSTRRVLRLSVVLTSLVHDWQRLYICVYVCVQCCSCLRRFVSDISPLGLSVAVPSPALGWPFSVFYMQLLPKWNCSMHYAMSSSNASYGEYLIPRSTTTHVYMVS